MALVLKPKEAPGAAQKPSPLVAGNEQVRFYIVHEVAGGGAITPSDYVRTSPFAMIQRKWTEALPEMAARFPGRGESLEIDCHGAPGILYLDPQLNRTSLPGFAAAARGLLRPYSTVEFLACKVANFDVPALIEYWKPRYDRKADVDFLTAWLEYNDALEYGGGRVHFNDGMTYYEDAVKKMGADEAARQATRGLVLEPREPKKPARTGMERLDHVRVVRLAMETGLFSFGDCYNGPLFCSRAARLLGCKVRAAMSPQPGEMTSGMGVGEFLATHDYSVMPIGSWQGHVFDFAPAGGVTYLGYNVPRGVYVPIRPGGEGPLRQA